MKKLWLVLTVALLFYTMTAWGDDCKTPVEEPTFKVWADKSFPEMSGGGDFPVLKCVVVAEWQGHIGNCPRQSVSLTQVTAYKASNGTLFETKEELDKHETKLKERKLYDKLVKMLRNREKPEFQGEALYLRGAADIVITYYPEIQAIMQDPAEKQIELTPEKRKAFIEFYYKCLGNGGETVFTIMFDNWSEFKAIMEGEK